MKNLMKRMFLLLCFLGSFAVQINADPADTTTAPVGQVEKIGKFKKYAQAFKSFFIATIPAACLLFCASKTGKRLIPSPVSRLLGDSRFFGPACQLSGAFAFYKIVSAKQNFSFGGAFKKVVGDGVTRAIDNEETKKTLTNSFGGGVSRAVSDPETRKNCTKILFDLVKQLIKDDPTLLKEIGVTLSLFGEKNDDALLKKIDKILDYLEGRYGSAGLPRILEELTKAANQHEEILKLLKENNKILKENNEMLKNKKSFDEKLRDYFGARYKDIVNRFKKFKGSVSFVPDSTDHSFTMTNDIPKKE